MSRAASNRADLPADDFAREVGKSSQSKKRSPINKALAAGDMYPLAVVTAFREQLPDDCREAFDDLVGGGCIAGRLVDYFTSLRLAHQHHDRLQSDPARMDRDKLRSLAERTRHVAKNWENVFNSPFGQEVLAFALRSDPTGTKAEFCNIPQRLRSLAQWAGDIHKGTTHRRRPLYDDTLAELLVYVKLAARKPDAKQEKLYLNQISILVGHATDNPSYSFNDLGTWKSEHKPNVERAQLRLQRQS